MSLAVITIQEIESRVFSYDFYEFSFDYEFVQTYYLPISKKEGLFLAVVGFAQSFSYTYHEAGR